MSIKVTAFCAVDIIVLWGHTSLFLLRKMNRAVKLSVCLIKHYVIKAYGGVGTVFHEILTLAVDGDEL
jgi:hypothetical protein